MKKIALKLMSLFLVFSLVVMGTVQVSAATNPAVNNVALTANERSAGMRTNLIFHEGKAGDTHLVYTYDQDGKSFKVVEDFSEGLTNGSSTTYLKNPDGNYVVFSTQEVSTTPNGDLVITLADTKRHVEKHVIPAAEKLNSGAQSKASASGDEWVTQTISGSTNITNFTINAIIAACAAIATYYCGSPAGQAAIAGLSSLAVSFYNYNATTAYYYSIYNWRHSPRDYFVIDETEWTDWYTDSAHNNYTGYTYYEYIY